MATKQDNPGNFRKYVVEFIGTFFFVLTIVMAMVGGIGHFVPIAAGMMLVVVMYSGYHISGGHFNPAVSLAVYLRGKLDAGDLLPYMVAQFLGGTLAAMLAGFLLGSLGTPEATPKDLTAAPSLIAEVLGTIFFVYVFLNVTSVKKTVASSQYGIAIGFVYMACLYTFGNVSIGAFNPAVALGITHTNLSSWASIWIFIVANFSGGALAAFLSQYVNGPDS
jgi:aquaporin Z